MSRYISQMSHVLEEFSRKDEGLFARSLATAITFPGSSKSVQKEIASDFIRRVATNLNKISHMTADFSATLLLEASGRPIPLNDSPTNSSSVLKERLPELQAVSVMLPGVSNGLSAALKSLQHPPSEGNNYSVNEEEMDSMGKLVSAVETLSVSINDLCAAASTSFPSGKGDQPIEPSMYPQKNNLRNNKSPLNSSDKKQLVQSPLLATAGRCLKASESLKKQSLAARPSKTSDEGDGYMSKVRSLLNLNDGIKGAEKLSFPYMREQLKLRFKAEGFTVMGADKNIIDCVHIPCSSVVVDRAMGQEKSAGIVLFCGPNAGLYECVSQADLKASWLGFYMELGFDVCLFNYRGYNLSTSSPSPYAVKSDAVAVARYVKENKRPSQLLVHGESIGGMLACHVANVVEVDLLICDRTFTSLDAVASRMLGSWAGYGLRFIGLWTSNVAKDYLSCKCPKVILQDPDDQIISNSASLKNGVSTLLTFGDNTWIVKTESRDYKLSNYLNETIPHSTVEEEDKILLNVEDCNILIKDAFIDHFYACLVYIAKNSDNLKKKKTSIRGRSDNFKEMDREIDGDIEMLGNKTIFNKYNNNNNNSNNNNNNESDNRDDASDISEKENNGVINNETLKALLEENNFSLSMEWLQNYFNLSIHDNKRTPITKVWLCLARLDGGSGQLLCQSMRWGIDGVRSWIASYVVWNASVGHDSFLPPNRVNFQKTISDLNCLIDQIHPLELKNDSMVIFIKKSLVCLESRQTHFSHINATERISTFSNEIKNSSIDNNNIDSFSTTNLKCCRSVCIIESVQSIKSFIIKDIINDKDKSKLGYLIPFHCGHNGWPSSNEINLLIAFIKSNINRINK